MRSKISTSGEGGFDYVIPSTVTLGELPVHNLAELIFTRLPRRSEQAEVILSHDANQFLRISLLDFRAMVARLYQDFSQKSYHQRTRLVFEKINDHLYHKLEILFNQCYTLWRFTVVYGLLPSTRKRNIVHNKAKYRDIKSFKFGAVS